MEDLVLPAEFTSVFVPFVHSIVDSKLTNETSIYEFAVQYFEDRVEARNSALSEWRDLGGNAAADFSYEDDSDPWRLEVTNLWEDKQPHVLLGPSFGELENQATWMDTEEASAEAEVSSSQLHSAGSLEMEADRQWFFNLDHSKTSPLDSSSSLTSPHQKPEELENGPYHGRGESSRGLDFVRSLFFCRAIWVAEEEGWMAVGGPVVPPPPPVPMKRHQPERPLSAADAIRSWYFGRAIAAREGTLGR